jgi:hypothetical protein
MHQSPQKQLLQRRDKYGEVEASSVQAERRLYQGEQPKARKLRDDVPRDGRGGRHHSRWD